MVLFGRTVMERNPRSGQPTKRMKPEMRKSNDVFLLQYFFHVRYPTGGVIVTYYACTTLHVVVVWLWSRIMRAPLRM